MIKQQQKKIENVNGLLFFSLPRRQDFMKSISEYIFALLSMEISYQIISNFQILQKNKYNLFLDVTHKKRFDVMIKSVTSIHDPGILNFKVNK